MQKCILIYDDDKELLMLCSIILRKQNYEVATRSECDNIIEDIKSIQPDIILMDLWIPKCGGEKAIKKMRDEKNLKHIPVLLFSANGDIEAISHKAGADGFMEKPFDINAFQKKIAGFL